MTVRILTTDAINGLRQLPDESVHCVVTSPPYWGLRSYTGEPGMIGLETTWDEHVVNLLAVFREVMRVMRKDAVCWLNYGDAYNAGTSAIRKASSEVDVGYWKDAGSIGDRRVKADGLKPKDLMLMPARLAIALQEDGWWVRSEVVWHKPNPMPESVTDRPTSAHEKVFLLTKASSYYYDSEAVRTHGGNGWHGDFASKSPKRRDSNGKGTKRDKQSGHGPRHAGFNERYAQNPATGANLRNVWQFATQSFPDAHYAVFPDKLAETCIKAGTSAHGVCAECGGPWARTQKERPEYKEWAKTQRYYGEGGKGTAFRENKTNSASAPVKYDTVGWHPTCACGTEAVVPATVLDCFGGAGTTGLVADRLGRNAVLIEISPEYAAMAKRRIEDDGGMFTDVVME